MPIYEYACQECGDEFEELVSASTEKNPQCPSCNSYKTEKKMSVFGGIGDSGCSDTSNGSSKFT